MMKKPYYISLDEARDVLADMNVHLSDRQLRRAAEKDAKGRRKLPFFVDPIAGTLRIEKGSLVDAYRRAQVEAENNLRQ
jgi:transglutaminase-like putative cysteine protease